MPRAARVAIRKEIRERNVDETMANRVFRICVELLEWLAARLGLTYEEINVLIFCIIWPLVTLALAIAVIVLL